MIKDVLLFEKTQLRSKTGTSTVRISCVCEKCKTEHHIMFRRLLKRDERTLCRTCRKREVTIGNDYGKHAKGVSRNVGDKNSNWKGGTKTGFAAYAAKAHYLSSKQPLHLLENFDKPRGRNGTTGAYQLDHIVSLHFAFVNKWSVEKVSSLQNLRFIPWEENLLKSNKLTGENP